MRYKILNLNMIKLKNDSLTTIWMVYKSILSLKLQIMEHIFMYVTHMKSTFFVIFNFLY